MKKRGLLIAMMAACSVAAIVLIGFSEFTNSVSAAAETDNATVVHAWTGVWQMTSPGKPGGTITLADDGGSLTGVIVFNVMNRETEQRIAIETRTMVNPHVQGKALVFQVRRILKPHLQGEPTVVGDQSDPTDIVDMTLTPGTEGKAILTCPKCGAASPMELVKQQ